MLLVLAGLAAPSGCVGVGVDESQSDSAARRQFPLDELATSTVSLKDQTFRVWLADNNEKRNEGLMWVADDEIEADEGMLFAFRDERVRGFWMRNTVIPLDIAFARADGTIVATHTMPPLTLRTFSSFEPAMFALEVEAGTFERLGVVVGDVIIIPDDVLKQVQ